MLRSILTFALVGVALGAASCRSSPSPARRAQVEREGALIHYDLKDYRTIVSAHRGVVGYLKVYDVTEGKGNPYPWKYVYDANWKQLGMVDQFGNAYVYHYYSPAEQAQQNEPLRLMRLPSDSIQRNVLRMMGIDPAGDDVTFPESTKADITGDTGAQHLAGPGITPAKAPPAVAPAK